MIIGVLNEYFGVAVRLEQFVGTWELLRPEEQASLGRNNQQLGADTMLGARYRRRDLCVRLWIGPLSRAEFEGFLPHASGTLALKALLGLFAEPNLRVEVCPILSARDVCLAQLNISGQLGRGVVLAGSSTPSNYDEMRYHIQF
jgi:type VI secretion system protein ImpH